nr:MAG TPA: hypothetical protein [Caudoviricetes sp.]
MHTSLRCRILPDKLILQMIMIYSIMSVMHLLSGKKVEIL